MSARDWYGKSSTTDKTADPERHGEEEQKTVIQSAQETVAKALGGGSRGAFFLRSRSPSPSQLVAPAGVHVVACLLADHVSRVVDLSLLTFDCESHLHRSQQLGVGGCEVGLASTGFEMCSV